MNRQLVAAGVLGASAIALGAWGAHGLASALEAWGREAGGIERRVENFNTASRYQLSVAVACLAVGAAPGVMRRSLATPVMVLVSGGIVFAGLLYAIALGPASWRWLGAVVPLGGLAMIVGWAMVAVAGFRISLQSREESQTKSASDIVRLEELLTHQQRLWQELDESLTALRDQSDDNSKRVDRLESAARQLIEHQRAIEPMPDEKPPHY